MSMRKKSRWLTAVCAALTLAVCGAAGSALFVKSARASAVSEIPLTVTEATLELGKSSYNNVSDTKVWFKAVVTFNTDAAVATGPNDAGSTTVTPFDTARLGKITLNGTELGTIWSDRSNYLGGTTAQQKIEDFFYADWLPDNADGKRALMLIMPVEYYTASGFGFRGDGTDTLVFPAGSEFSTPEGDCFDAAETVRLAAPEERISLAAVSTRETDLTYDAAADTFAGFAEVMMHFDVPNSFPGWMTELEGNADYTGRVSLNGTPLCESGGNFFLRNNSVWEPGLSSTYAWHATLMLYLNPAMLHAGKNTVVVSQTFPLYKALTLTKGYVFSLTLDATQAVGSRIVFEETQASSPAVTAFETVSETRICVGKPHGLPATVDARTEDGSVLRDLPVVYDWNTKDAAGEYDLIGTVTLPDGYEMKTGEPRFTVRVNVDHYIKAFASVSDVSGAIEVGMGHNLPTTVQATLENDETVELPINWDWTVAHDVGEIPLVGTIDVTKKGSDLTYYLAEGLSVTVEKTVTVVAEQRTEIVSFAEIPDMTQSIKVGEKHTLPAKTTATLADGTTEEFEIRWSWTTAAQLGDITVTGTIQVDYDAYRLAENVSATVTKTVRVIAAEEENRGGKTGGCNSALGGSFAVLGVGILAVGGAMLMQRKKNGR